MPPKARPDCKIDGCGQPRYVFPSGSRSVYCRAHLKLRNTKTRGSLEGMTGQMKAILLYLRDQRDGDEYLFVDLRYPFAHGKTLKKLIDRDWLFRSESAIDGTVKYKITGRGLKALKVYEPKLNRKDGLCPRCGKRPRPTTRSGRKAHYCHDCQRKISARKDALGLTRVNPARPCSRCHEQPLYRYPNGRYSTYCEQCERLRRRLSARKQRARLLKSIQAGGPVPPCKYCKQRPRRVYRNSISESCLECGRKLQKKYRKSPVAAAERNAS